MPNENPNARLEAFCDGVFAIAATLLVIDVKLPATGPVESTGALWLALGRMGPAVGAFVLSFAIIFITWVNHHAMLKLVRGSSSSFIYSNGLLLLSVVFLPFPTGLLGEYVLTDHGGPAVALYNAVLVVQAVSWILLSGTALSCDLARGERAAAHLRTSGRYGWVAVALYAVFAVLAVYFPRTIAALTVVVWMFWLVLGITIKPE
jgi:TMEM175 potassium channel family protein